MITGFSDIVCWARDSQRLIQRGEELVSTKQLRRTGGGTVGSFVFFSRSRPIYVLRVACMITYVWASGLPLISLTGLGHIAMATCWGPVWF